MNIYVSYEESIISVMSMLFSNNTVSSEVLNGKLLINDRISNFNTFQYPNIANHLKPEDLLFGYLNGDIQDCMILACLPFSIDLENKSTHTYSKIVDQFTIIPIEQSVFIEEASDYLNVKFRSENKEVLKTVSFGQPIKNTDLGFFIDANYMKGFELPSGKTIYF